MPPGEEELPIRDVFEEVIRRAYEQTGHGVVILIDEYDKPLLNSFHNEELQEEFRRSLTAFIVC